MNSFRERIANPLQSKKHVVHLVASIGQPIDIKTENIIKSYTDNIKEFKRGNNQRDNIRLALMAHKNIISGYQRIIVMRYDVEFKPVFQQDWLWMPYDFVFPCYEPGNKRINDVFFIFRASLFDKLNVLLSPQYRGLVHSLHCLHLYLDQENLTYTTILKNSPAPAGVPYKNPLYNLRRDYHLSARGRRDAHKTKHKNNK